MSLLSTAGQSALRTDANRRSAGICANAHPLSADLTAQPSNTHSEFLIHAADVEGLCQGIDEQLFESEYMRTPWPGDGSDCLLTSRPNLWQSWESGSPSRQHTQVVQGVGPMPLHHCPPPCLC
jgi:hypothetical protein